MGMIDFFDRENLPSKNFFLYVIFLMTISQNLIKKQIIVNALSVHIKAIVNYCTYICLDPYIINLTEVIYLGLSKLLKHTKYT